MLKRTVKQGSQAEGPSAKWSIFDWNWPIIDSGLDIITFKTTLCNKFKNCVFLISYFKRNFTIKQFAADCSHSWLVLWVDSVFLLNSIIKCPIQNVTYKNFCTIWVRNRLWYQTVNSIPSWWFIHISPSHIFCKIMVPSELKKLWPTLSPSDVTYK